MFSLNNQSSQPIYQQVKKQLIEAIALGYLPADQQLPSVRVLAKDLGVNPNTIMKAYQDCEAEGYIYSITGKGSFVSRDNSSVQKLRDSILEQMIDLMARGKTIGITYDVMAHYLREFYKEKQDD